MTVLHATTVGLFERGAWRGVLLTGASGAGKSDLALRLLAAGARLVADDRTLVWASGGALYGQAPETLSGLIEARGLGLAYQPPLPFVRIALVVALDGEAAERLPEPRSETLAGVAIQRLRLEAREASAPAKLHLALRGCVRTLGGEA